MYKLVLTFGLILKLKSNLGGGKSRADTWAAITKHKVTNHVRGGGFADTPASFAQAIVDSGGVANVSCQIGGIKGKLPDPKTKIPNLKDFHQLIFLDGAILARKIPGVGKGQLIPMKGFEMNVKTEYKCKLVNAHQMKDNRPERKTAQPFVSKKPFLGSGTLSTEKIHFFEEQISEEVEPESSSSLFTCNKNPHCSMKFIREHNYEKHVEKEDACKIRIKHPTYRDMFITWNVSDAGLPNTKDLLKTPEGRQMLLTLQKPKPANLDKTLPLASTNLTSHDVPLFDQCTMGHCLPKPRKVVKFSPEVHLFAYELFKEGVVPGGKKVTALQAVERMKLARNSDGSMRFPNWKEWLEERQVSPCQMR